MRAASLEIQSADMGGVPTNLEGQGAKRVLLGWASHDTLPTAGARDLGLDRGTICRRWEVVRHGVHQRLDSLVLECRSQQHRDSPAALSPARIAKARFSRSRQMM